LFVAPKQHKQPSATAGCMFVLIALQGDHSGPGC
jgi:hypothetical protein